MTVKFKRKEVKYLLTEEQREAVEQAMAEYMKEDEFGESIIRNVYFDTATGLLCRRSLEKPLYKEKLRIRSYCRIAENQNAFLELKKKYKGIVYKRRIRISEKEFYEYLDGKRPFPEEGQIAREIDYFCRMYKTIQPRMYLCYDRCAYFGNDDPDFRVTFDRNIRWRTDRLSLSEEAGGEDLLDEGMSLMEIKAADAMPLWMVRVLTEQRVQKVSFSKYGTAYTQLTEMRGTIQYA